jgi:hypothetical protein
MKSRFQYSLRGLMITIAVGSIVLTLGSFVANWVAGPVISGARLRRIEPGMTQHQVIEILGEPQSRKEGEWHYERIGNPGWVEVWFDDDGRVQEVNDESVFPPHAR